MALKNIKLEDGEILCKFITMQGVKSTVEIAVLKKDFCGRDRYINKSYMQVDDNDEPAIFYGPWCDTYKECMEITIEQAKNCIVFTIF